MAGLNRRLGSLRTIVTEVNVLAKLSLIEPLAARIEHSYRLRRHQWMSRCTSPQVWSAAARALLSVCDGDRPLPADPELFVASQPVRPSGNDPWQELTSPEAMENYRRSVRAIVRGLKAEISAELRRAGRRFENGEAVSVVLLSSDHRLSPLGRYIAARRAGRPALARRIEPEALAQHRCCPLYAVACEGLIPREQYPSADHDAGQFVLTAPGASGAGILLN